MGDGGTGIGGAHLLGAARRNIGITVIVMNNLNFGVTGGQHLDNDAGERDHLDHPWRQPRASAQYLRHRRCERGRLRISWDELR